MRLTPCRSRTLRNSRSVNHDAVDEALEGGIEIGRASGDGGHGTLEVVADIDDVMGETGDGVFGGVLLFLLGALADVVDLGVGAQDLVLEVGDLAAQVGDDVVVVLGCGLGRLIGGSGGLLGRRADRRLRRAEQRRSPGVAARCSSVPASCRLPWSYIPCIAAVLVVARAC